MGLDSGFDMVPRLSRSDSDRQEWTRFIETVKDIFDDDAQVDVKPNYIEFMAGEHPKLPLEGHKFLRFSSKITGSVAPTTQVERYIDIVKYIAKYHFGSRIHYWDECFDQQGHYNGAEVLKSIRSYEQPDESDEQETRTRITHLPNDASSASEPVGNPLFDVVKDIPGKGRGLIARCDIPKGTRIVCEKPLLMAPNMRDRDEMEIFLALKLKVLSKAEVRQFLSLHNNYKGKNPFSGIMRTNALPCGSGTPVGGIYPTICLINHSCLPNAHSSWNDEEKHETIHATRPIKAGEEITISYEPGKMFADRQAFLKKEFGFECNCSQCSLPPHQRVASDARRLQMLHLDDVIVKHVQTKPIESLRHCRRLLQVLEEEYDGGAAVLSAMAYYDALQICIAHGDRARASVFAERAYQSRLVCEGEDSSTTQEMKSLMLEPEKHVAYRLYSKKWKSAKDTVPKGLGTAQFETWLFKDQSQKKSRK